MLFAHLKQRLGIRRLRLRGLLGAAEEFQLAAAVLNLRRLARLTARAAARRARRRPLGEGDGGAGQPAAAAPPSATVNASPEARRHEAPPRLFQRHHPFSVMPRLA